MLGVVAYLASRLEELRSSGDMEGALAMMGALSGDMNKKAVSRRRLQAKTPDANVTCVSTCSTVMEALDIPGIVATPSTPFWHVLKDKFTEAAFRNRLELRLPQGLELPTQLVVRTADGERVDTDATQYTAVLLALYIDDSQRIGTFVGTLSAAYVKTDISQF